MCPGFPVSDFSCRCSVLFAPTISNSPFEDTSVSQTHFQLCDIARSTMNLSRSLQELAFSLSRENEFLRFQVLRQLFASAWMRCDWRTKLHCAGETKWCCLGSLIDWLPFNIIISVGDANDSDQAGVTQQEPVFLHRCAYEPIMSWVLIFSGIERSMSKTLSRTNFVAFFLLFS